VKKGCGLPRRRHLGRPPWLPAAAVRGDAAAAPVRVGVCIAFERVNASLFWGFFRFPHGFIPSLPPFPALTHTSSSLTLPTYKAALTTSSSWKRRVPPPCPCHFLELSQTQPNATSPSPLPSSIFPYAPTFHAHHPAIPHTKHTAHITS